MPGPQSTVARRAGRAAAALIAAAGLVASLVACRAPDPVATSPVGASAAATSTTPAAGPADPDASPWPTDASGGPVGWLTCANTVHHTRIGYPAGWHTASVGAQDACSLFDPVAFTVEDGPNLPTQQLWAFYQPEGAAAFLTDLFNPDFFTLTSHVDVTIGGRHAIRYEVTCLPPRGPSGPTYPVGSHIYGYVIEDATGHSLDVATYAEPGDATYAHRQHIVDQAVTTVQFA